MQGGPPQAPKRSTGKALLVGCLGLIAVTCLFGVGAFTYVSKSVSGTELANFQVQPGAPFLYEFRPHGRGQVSVWLEVDATFENGFNLDGQVTALSSGSSASHTLHFANGGACENPVAQSTSSMCLNWRVSHLNGHGEVSGRTRMFTVPTTPGQAGSLSGVITPGPGTTLRSLRLRVQE